MKQIIQNMIDGATTRALKKIAVVQECTSLYGVTSCIHCERIDSCFDLPELGSLLDYIVFWVEAGVRDENRPPRLPDHAG